MYHNQLRKIKHVGDVREKSVSEFWPIVHDLEAVTLQVIYQTHILWSMQHLYTPSM